MSRVQLWITYLQAAPLALVFLLPLMFLSPDRGRG